MNRAWKRRRVCVSAANICKRANYTVRIDWGRSLEEKQYDVKVDYIQLHQICTNSVSAPTALYGFFNAIAAQKHRGPASQRRCLARSCFCCPLPYLISSLFHQSDGPTVHRTASSLKHRLIDHSVCNGNDIISTISASDHWMPLVSLFFPTPLFPLLFLLYFNQKIKRFEFGIALLCSVSMESPLLCMLATTPLNCFGYSIIQFGPLYRPIDNFWLSFVNTGHFIRLNLCSNGGIFQFFLLFFYFELYVAKMQWPFRVNCNEIVLYEMKLIITFRACCLAHGYVRVPDCQCENPFVCKNINE